MHLKRYAMENMVEVSAYKILLFSRYRSCLLGLWSHAIAGLSSTCRRLLLSETKIP